MLDELNVISEIIKMSMFMNRTKINKIVAIYMNNVCTLTQLKLMQDNIPSMYYSSLRSNRFQSIVLIKILKIRCCHKT